VTRVLALDLGTSSARARLYDERGRQAEGVEAQERYTETRGHSGRLGEFDADELVEVVRSAVEESLRAAGGPVEAVATSSFWHSLLALDARGRPLTPVSSWRDTRASDAAEELARRLDGEAVHRRTGCPLHSSFWPARLERLRREEPEVFRAAARFVSCPDYVLERLAGTLRTSLSTASATGLLGLDGRWDEELLGELELDPERLPEISDEPFGAAEPWFPAWGDGACANVGAGCVTRDRAALTIGTSGAFRVVYEADEPRARPGLFLFRVDGRRVVEGGSLSDGGNLWDWLERTLSETDADGLADEPADGHGLTFLTLLGGERSPGWDARVRGAVAGLSFHATPRELVHAALEGVAFRVAEVAELLPEAREVVATGAALLRNRDWAQIVADVLGRPVRMSAVEEASARGAAVLALERLGEAPEPAPLGDALEQREERTTIYLSARGRQRALYDAIARAPLRRD
jgi:gluconokinase